MITDKLVFNRLYSSVYCAPDPVESNVSGYNYDLYHQRKKAFVKNSILTTVTVIGCIVGSAFCPPLALFFIIILLAALVSFFSQLFHTCDRSNGFLCFGPTAGPHDPGWLVSPRSLQRLFLMTLEWIEDAVASPFRSLEYLYHHFFNSDKENFNSIIKRRGAYGNLTGAVLSGLGVALFCILVFNPYTAVGLLGLVTAIITTVVIGAVIAKTFEFFGRLSGAVRTKQLADQQIKDHEAREALNHQTECTIEFVKTLPTNAQLQERFRLQQKIPDYFLVEDNHPGVIRCVPHLVTSEGDRYVTSVARPPLTNPYGHDHKDYKEYQRLNSEQQYKIDLFIENLRPTEDDDASGPPEDAKGIIIEITKEEADILLLYKHSPRKKEVVGLSPMPVSGTSTSLLAAAEAMTPPPAMRNGFKTLSYGKIAKHTLMGSFLPKLSAQEKVGSAVIDSSVLERKLIELSVPSVPSVSSERTSYSLETPRGKSIFSSAIWREEDRHKHATYNPALKQSVVEITTQNTPMETEAIANLMADYYTRP